MPKPCSGDPRKAVGYIRVSTHTEKQSLGAEAQRRAIERWAQGTGVTILDWFVEEVSGGAPLDKRPVLLEAIATVASLGASSLICQRLDRFSRDPLTAALAEAELQRHGATLVVADGAGNVEDATAALIRSILYAVSRFEKEMIRARIKAAFAVKRARGERVGAAPYGMKTDGKALAIHPQEAATVDRLRELRSSGLTLRAVVDQATAEGRLNRAGKPFSLAAVHKLMKSAA